MAAKKKAEPVVGQPLTSQAASTAARATELNADDIQSSQAPAEVQATIPIAPTPDPVVGQPLTSQTALTSAETADPNTDEGPSPQASADRVIIPIDPYPGFDESYLQSFELLRNNVYEAVFSLGRLANAFRFSQGLFHYRTYGCDVGIPDDFFTCINDCLSLLDRETRSAPAKLLLNYISRPRHHPGHYEPVEHESWWDDLCCEVRDGGSLFRRPLSEGYEFSLNTRAESSETTQNQDLSGWLDCFESLYEKIRQGDHHLAEWMMAGWKVDRLVRPEMSIHLLVPDYDDPHPSSPFGTIPPAPAPRRRQFDCNRTLCGVGGYQTQDPVSRNAGARLIFLTLSSQRIALEHSQSLLEFETIVSNWVRLCAAKRLLAKQIPESKKPPPVLTTEEEREQKLLLDSLSLDQKWWVFCGRIWKQYEKECDDETLKNMTEAETAGKLPVRVKARVKDCYEIAKQKGWKLGLDEFMRCQNTGASNRQNSGPWRDFVQGTKGKDIPLEKFLELSE